MAVGRRHGVDDGVDGGQVRVARVGGRRADRDEQQPRVLERVREVGGEVQAVAVALDQLGQARLPDRHPPCAQAFDLLRVDVDAVDVVAELGEPGRGDQADIPRTDDADRFSIRAHRRRVRLSRPTCRSTPGMTARIPAILAAALVAALAPAATAAAKTINGSNAAEAISGTEGPDSIKARGGADRVRGLGGDDKIFGETGPDDLGGGAGNDWMDGSSGDDNINGDDGNDTGIGGFGHDTLVGGPGDDNMDGGAAPDQVEGGDGNDTLRGGSGGDDIFGGAGNDTLYSDTGPDHIEAGDGDDVVYINFGSDIDLVDCGAGNDTIYVNPRGEPGGVSQDRDLRDGDIVNCENVIPQSAPVDPTKGISSSVDGGTLRGADAQRQPARRPRLREALGLDGDDVLWGDQNHDDGGAAARKQVDTLDGGAGNDTVYGGRGTNNIFGGDGNDYLQGGGRTSPDRRRQRRRHDQGHLRRDDDRPRRRGQRHGHGDHRPRPRHGQLRPRRRHRTSSRASRAIASWSRSAPTARSASATS